MTDKTKLELAFEVIKQAMIDDEPSKPGSLAHAWHCNIAMSCLDAITSKEYDAPYGFDDDMAHKIANDGASRFMRICFDVETKG